jgi:hypothetical protein
MKLIDDVPLGGAGDYVTIFQSPAADDLDV